MFGKKHKKMFNRELLEEEKIILFKEYGTTDQKEISKICKALSEYVYKLRCKNLELKFNNLSVEEHITLVHLILKRHRIAARERHALHMPSNSKKPTPSEEIINDLDKLILLKQMSQKGYTKAQSEAIYNSINEKYRTTTCDLLSIDFDHYNVDEKLSVEIKTTKERYDIMTKKLQAEKCVEM